jgi:hypothetical protein
MITFDKSLRDKDENGFLHVESSHISKASVNPYLGKEIPGWKELGLEPDTVYQVYRPAEELRNAASTFNRLPVLSEHVPIYAEDYAEQCQRYTIGTTGDNATFSEPYLDNGLTIWDKTYIDTVEDGSQREISCAYRYDPKLEVGEFEGKPYTIIMTNLRGNHVAIVKEGRAGSDVVVADSKPNRINMSLLTTLKKALGIAMDSKNPQSKAVGKALLAMDAEGIDPEATENTLLDAMKDINSQEEQQEGVGTDSESDAGFLDALKKFIAQYEAGQQQNPMQPAGAAGDEDPKAEGPDKEEEKPAMDAATIRRDIETSLRAEMRKKANAAAKVHPYVGTIDAMSFDSAADIFRLALDSRGFTTEGKSEEALESMVDVMLSAKPSHEFAQDSRAASAGIYDKFPRLKNIKVR